MRRGLVFPSRFSGNEYVVHVPNNLVVSLVSCGGKPSKFYWECTLSAGNTLYSQTNLPDMVASGLIIGREESGGVRGSGGRGHAACTFQYFLSIHACLNVCLQSLPR